MSFEDLPTVGYEEAKPDAGGVAQAFARIGYQLEEALADLVDNSVDAGAGNILIRFYRDSNSIKRIVVVDDGRGMSPAEVRRAMQFGVRQRHKKSDLGKYGMGLKTASFSQCRSLTVLTRHREVSTGRRWTLSSIEKGWLTEKVSDAATHNFFLAFWTYFDIIQHGSIIVWDDLDQFKVLEHGFESGLTRILRQIDKHLGLVFHRLINESKCRISVDTYNYQTDAPGPQFVVRPLDPFSYTRAGKAGYPKIFRMLFSDLPPLRLEAHIWPPHSVLPGYKLGGGNVAARQGFYIYRNNRLIQAGGWNGWRESDSEPHVSLARIKIDIKDQYGDMFRLKVQKSGMDVSQDFRNALSIVSSGKTTLTDFVQDAVSTYRKSQPELRRTCLVPGKGVLPKIQSVMKSALAEKNDVIGTIDFEWKQLPPKIVFYAAADECRIYLNSKYREKLSQKTRTSTNDAAVVKTLLFMLLRDELQSRRQSEKSTRAIEALNSVLYAIVSGDRNG